MDEKPLDPLTLEIYAPQSRGGFTICDPAQPEIQVSYELDGHHLRLETSHTPGLVEVILYGVEVAGVHANGLDLPLTKTGIGGWRFQYGGTSPASIEVVVKEG